MFTDSQVALLKTFADQAAIAIENVRLFTELEARNRDLTEALEQQTATSEILRVISESRTDVQAVFDTIASAMHRLLRVSAANVFTFDGKLVHLVASVNDNKDYLEVIRRMFPRPPSRDTAGLRAVFTGQVAAIPDVLEDSDYVISELSSTGGFRGALAVPLLRDGIPIGAIAVGRPLPGPFSEQQVSLLQTFADQAVIAIENVRLFKELQARTRDLTRSVSELKALGDVGQAVSSTLDLETVLSTIVSRANQLSGMDGCAIYEYDEARGEFYLHTADSLPDELVAALRASPIQKGEGALGALAVTGEPTQVRDIMDERVYQSRVKKILIKHGYRSLLAVPLLRENHLLGGLVVNRKSAGEFAPEVIDLLKTFATQSALAIQNARLFREIEVKSRQLEDRQPAQERVPGQHVARAAHAAQRHHRLFGSPVRAAVRRAERQAGRVRGRHHRIRPAPPVPHQRHPRPVQDRGRQDGARRLRIRSRDGHRQHADAGPGARAAARHRAALHSRRGRATIQADERKVKQVLLNLLSNALKFTPEGGAVDVRATAHDDRVEIAVTDTGVGIAPEDQDAVFEEFRQVGSHRRKSRAPGSALRSRASSSNSTAAGSG